MIISLKSTHFCVNCFLKLIYSSILSNYIKKILYILRMAISSSVNPALRKGEEVIKGKESSVTRLCGFPQKLRFLKTPCEFLNPNCGIRKFAVFQNFEIHYKRFLLFLSFLSKIDIFDKPCRSLRILRIFSKNLARFCSNLLVTLKERGKEKKKEEGERRNDRNGRRRKKTFFPGKIKQQVIKKAP